MRRTGTTTARAVRAVLAAVALACGADPSDVPSVGTLERKRLELVAEAPEPIVEIAVQEGDRVETGALLVRLEDARLAAAARQTHAERERARARLAELQRGPRVERIAEARARLAGAESAVSTARRELERVRALEQQAVTSVSRLDQQRTALDEAVSRRDQARHALEALTGGTTAEELEQARGALEAADAALAQARVRLARLTLRAPRAGWVDALPFEEGERPPPGATLAVLLADARPYARVYVPEPLRVHVAPGLAARIHVDGIDAAFRGRVRSVAHDPVFTPYFALTERDRGRLAWLAEVEVLDEAARELPSGVPVQVHFSLGDDVAREGVAR